MNFNFFRKRPEFVDVRVEGERGSIEKKRRWLVPVIIIAIVVLAFGNFGSDDSADDKTKPAEKTVESNCAEVTEEKLQEMISSMKGVGQVKVMVVIDYKSEKTLAANSRTNKETQSGGENQTTKISDEENIILFGKGADEQPYVLKEKNPVPSGVFVTATGASDEKVKLEIYEAIKALYGISGHRIKVASAKEG